MSCAIDRADPEETRIFDLGCGFSIYPSWENSPIVLVDLRARGPNSFDV